MVIIEQVSADATPAKRRPPVTSRKTISNATTDVSWVSSSITPELMIRRQWFDLAYVLPVMLVAYFLAGGTFYQVIRLVFGTMLPAYNSYKAVKTKDVKEYVKWMMYWIVFALFSFVETFTDLFIGFWFPFYNEIKICIVLWLISPMTRGSSFLYRNVIHPWLSRREGNIDECIEWAKQQGYSTLVGIGTKGAELIVDTAVKSGGGLVSHIKQSYSGYDLTETNGNRNVKPVLDDTNSAGSTYNETGVRTRSNSVGKKVRANKTRSVDVYDAFHEDDLQKPLQEGVRFQPMQHYPESVVKDKLRKRGHCDPRTKSLIDNNEANQVTEMNQAFYGSTSALPELAPPESSSEKNYSRSKHSVRNSVKATSSKEKGRAKKGNQKDLELFSDDDYE